MNILNVIKVDGFMLLFGSILLGFCDPMYWIFFIYSASSCSLAARPVLINLDALLE